MRACVRAGVTEAIQVFYGSYAGVTEDILQFGLRVECNLGKGSIAIWSKELRVRDTRYEVCDAWRQI